MLDPDLELLVVVSATNVPCSCGGQSSALGLRWWARSARAHLFPALPAERHFGTLLLVSELQPVQPCEGLGLGEARLLHQRWFVQEGQETSCDCGSGSVPWASPV